MLRKDPVQFIQAKAFKNTPIEEEFEDTFAEDMIQDFYTASHPYAFLAIPVLANAAEVLHTNPEIFYLPKQPALGMYNKTHGNEIYMIEERPEEAEDGAAVPRFQLPRHQALDQSAVAEKPGEVMEHRFAARGS